MFTNKTLVNDDVSDIVADIMKETRVRLAVTEAFNKELGIETVKALPFSQQAAYNAELNERVSRALTGKGNSVTGKQVVNESADYDKAEINDKEKRLKRYVQQQNPSSGDISLKALDRLKKMKKSVNEKVTNAATAALTNRVTSGMSKKQANTLAVGDKVTIPSGRPGGAGTTYTAGKGDSRWRISQRHLRAGEAQSNTRNKDDAVSAAPKPATPAKTSPSASDAARGKTPTPAPAKTSPSASDAARGKTPGPSPAAKAIAASAASAGGGRQSSGASLRQSQSQSNPVDTRIRNDGEPKTREAVKSQGGTNPSITRKSNFGGMSTRVGTGTDARRGSGPSASYSTGGVKSARSDFGGKKGTGGTQSGGAKSQVTINKATQGPGAGRDLSRPAPNPNSLTRKFTPSTPLGR